MIMNRGIYIQNKKKNNFVLILSCFWIAGLK